MEKPSIDQRLEALRLSQHRSLMTCNTSPEDIVAAARSYVAFLCEDAPPRPATLDDVVKRLDQLLATDWHEIS